MNSEKIQERCQYFIQRKSRMCRMLVKSGHKYCGEHAGEERKRIPCPLDPKHTVNEDELQAHLRKCNSRLNTGLPYIRRDVNGASDGEATDKDSEAFSLAQLTDDELKAAVEKVEAVFAKLDVRVENAYLEHECMKAAAESETYGTNAKRHLRQQSSILGHADRLRLLDIGKKDSVCYVEFGAGRAKLSYWLAKAVEGKLSREQVDASSPPSPQVSFLLVERSGQRYKFENKLTQEDANQVSNAQPAKTPYQFRRIRCAIEHVDLRLVDCVQRSHSCVAFCKHLCGSGTDAAMRSLVNATDPDGRANGVKSVNIAAAVLAPCCHHRCEWRSFVGQKTLAQLGLTEVEFKILVSMSSWATCGLVNAEGGEGGLDRKAIGKKCKLLLDYARTKYLEDSGRFTARLCYYVPEDVTPENLLIILTASA